MAGYLADLGVTHAYSSPAAARPRAATTATTRSTTRTSTRRGAGGRLRPIRRRAAPARARPGARPGAQPHGRRRPVGRPVVVGRAAARSESARGGVRHRLGVRRRQGAPPGPGYCGRRRKLEVVAGELRYYENRFPDRARHRAGDAAGGARPPALRAGRLAARGPDLNYRRFFAINTLAGLRVEDPAIFDATHGPCSRWCRRAPSTGCGSTTPTAWRTKGYLERLAEASGGRWTVVEKILEPGEDLPESWRTAGRRATRSPRTRCSSTRPARPAHRAGHRARRPDVDYGSCTTASARSPTACSAPRSPGWSG